MSRQPSIVTGGRGGVYRSPGRGRRGGSGSGGSVPSSRYMRCCSSIFCSPNNESTEVLTGCLPRSRNLCGLEKLILVAALSSARPVEFSDSSALVRSAPCSFILARCRWRNIACMSRSSSSGLRVSPVISGLSSWDNVTLSRSLPCVFAFRLLRPTSPGLRLLYARVIRGKRTAASGLSCSRTKDLFTAGCCGHDDNSIIYAFM